MYCEEIGFFTHELLPYALRQQAAVQEWADSNESIARTLDTPLAWYDLYIPPQEPSTRAESALDVCKISLIASSLDTVFQLAEVYSELRLPPTMPAEAARAIAQSQADSMDAWRALGLHDRTSSASIARLRLRDEKLAEIVRDYVADLCSAVYAAPTSVIMLERAKQHVLWLLEPAETVDYPDQGQLDIPLGLQADSGLSQSPWRLDAAAALACAERQLDIPLGLLDGGLLQYAPSGRAFAVKIAPEGRELLRAWALSPSTEDTVTAEPKSPLALLVAAAEAAAAAAEADI